MNLPTFTLAELAKDSARLDAACRDWGVFQLADVRQGAFDVLDRVGRDFFDRASQEKACVRRTADNAWGWYDQELTKNARDWKEIYDVGPAETSGPLAGSRPQWPAQPEGFQAAVTAAVGEFEALSGIVLRALAVALGAEPARLATAYAPTHTSFLRLNWYPPCPNPAAPATVTVPTEGHLGIHHHTDAGALTLLLQDDVSALQVWRRDQWHDVPPVPDGLTVNLGDIL